MSYDTSNPPREIVNYGFSTPGHVWLYESTDEHTDVDADGYFTDAGRIGMKVGDIVIVRKTDTGATTLHSVTALVTGAGYDPEKAATVSAAVLA